MADKKSKKPIARGSGSVANGEEQKGEILLFQTDGHTRVQVRFEDKNVWLTQAAMAELFQTTPQNITLHLKSIYQEQELFEEATCKEYLQVRQEGKRQINRQLKYYNLEAVIAVGYRAKSHRGTQFRQWATAHLQEFLVKGFEKNPLSRAGQHDNSLAQTFSGITGRGNCLTQSLLRRSPWD